MGVEGMKMNSEGLTILLSLIVKLKLILRYRKPKENLPLRFFRSSYRVFSALLIESPFTRRCLGASLQDW